MNRLLLARASFGASLLLLGNSADAASLAPHRAFYDLTMKRTEKGSNVVNVTGKLAYEITGSKCEGYAVNYRIANRLTFVEGAPQVFDTHLNSWESGDGLEVDITQKQFVDSKLGTENRYKVKKADKASAGKGEVIGANTREFETEPAAIFPTAFQLRLVEVALNGETRDNSIVYDGAEDDKAMRVISFIGGKKSKLDMSKVAKAEDLPKLQKLAAWPVSISYYAQGSSEDAAPAYQADFTMLENGVSTDLVLDYGTYTLEGKLEKLELLKEDDCK